MTVCAKPIFVIIEDHSKCENVMGMDCKEGTYFLNRLISNDIASEFLEVFFI